MLLGHYPGLWMCVIQFAQFSSPGAAYCVYYRKLMVIWNTF